MKLNKSSQVEAISITVTKEKYPIVFENKVQELMEDKHYTKQVLSVLAWNGDPSKKHIEM